MNIFKNIFRRHAQHQAAVHSPMLYAVIEHEPVRSAFDNGNRFDASTALANLRAGLPSQAELMVVYRETLKLPQHLPATKDLVVELTQTVQHMAEADLISPIMHKKMTEQLAPLVKRAASPWRLEKIAPKLDPQAGGRGIFGRLASFIGLRPA